MALVWTLSFLKGFLTLTMNKLQQHRDFFSFLNWLRLCKKKSSFFFGVSEIWFYTESKTVYRCKQQGFIRKCSTCYISEGWRWGVAVGGVGGILHQVFRALFIFLIQWKYKTTWSCFKLSFNWLIALIKSRMMLQSIKKNHQMFACSYD